LNGFFKLEIPHDKYAKDSLFMSIVGFEEKFIAIQDFIDGGYYDIFLVETDISSFHICMAQDFFAAIEILPDVRTGKRGDVCFIGKMATVRNPTYSRDYYNIWEKIPIGTALNITVQYEK
jgi:hypothetical protein